MPTLIVLIKKTETEEAIKKVFQKIINIDNPDSSLIATLGCVMPGEITLYITTIESALSYLKKVNGELAEEEIKIANYLNRESLNIEYEKYTEEEYEIEQKKFISLIPFNFTETFSKNLLKFCLNIILKFNFPQIKTNNELEIIIKLMGLANQKAQDLDKELLDNILQLVKLKQSDLIPYCIKLEKNKHKEYASIIKIYFKDNLFESEDVEIILDIEKQIRRLEKLKKEQNSCKTLYGLLTGRFGNIERKIVSLKEIKTNFIELAESYVKKDADKKIINQEMIKLFQTAKQEETFKSSYCRESYNKANFLQKLFFRCIEKLNTKFNRKKDLEMLNDAHNKKIRSVGAS